MTLSASGRRSGGYLERPAPSSLADVIDSILDKGLVIDAYVRVSRSGSNDFTSSGPRQSLRVDDAAGKAN